MAVRVQLSAVAAGMAIPKISTMNSAVQRVVLRSRWSFMVILICGDMVSLYHPLC